MCVLKQSIPPYDQKPFHFVETGINVYSFEELLFHCYHYWKESISDFLDGHISVWVKDTLKLTFLSAKIDKLINADEMLSEKFLKFLSLEDYFDKDTLYMLEFKIMTWENKSELDKLKQQGDERLETEDYEKAVFYYNKLLTYTESAEIYNNIGCCYMKMGQYGKAEDQFALALGLDRRNYRIKLNVAMLYLLQNKSLAAEQLLSELEKTDNGSEVQYYLGNLEFRRGNYKKAGEFFSRSAEMGNVTNANAALCKIEMKRKNFNAARDYLERIPDKASQQYLYNLAQVHYQTGEVGKALINAEKLLVKNFDKASYWSFAAKLYRETGSLTKAQNAIDKALEYDSTNDEALFEGAKIKNALGETTEYRDGIKHITERWKSRFKAAVN